MEVRSLVGWERGMTTLTPTRETLNGMVEWDSPFQIHEDGTLTPYLPGVYSPEGVDSDGEADGPWTALDGWSGQYLYSGPCMHPSEYLGGRMAQHVIETPGVYVLTEVRDEDGEYPDGDPIGWVLLRHDSPTP